MSKPVSEKQEEFLNKLAAEKLPNGKDDLAAMIAEIPGFMVIGGGREGLASQLIEKLMALPKQQRQSGPKADPPVGIHFVDGTYIKVQVSRTSGGKYGKALTDIDTKDWEYIGQRGLYRQLSDETVLTAEQAAHFGHTYSWCVFCGTELSDDRSGCSLDVGYGPVCAKKHGLPWGPTSKKSAPAPQPELPVTFGDDEAEMHRMVAEAERAEDERVAAYKANRDGGENLALVFLDELLSA
jgi:hypothetical protein